MTDTEKPCACEVVDIHFCGPDEVDYTICYCPLHAAAPDGLKLARAVRGSTHITPRIMVLARHIIEAAGPKERR